MQRLRTREKFFFSPGGRERDNKQSTMRLVLRGGKSTLFENMHNNERCCLSRLSFKRENKKLDCFMSELEWKNGSRSKKRVKIALVGV